MRFSEEWLQERARQNPALRFSVQGGKTDGTAVNIQAGQAEVEKPGKYHNRKVYVYENGQVANEKHPEWGKPLEKYDSEKEYARCQELRFLESIGGISNLVCQKPLVILDAFEYQGKKIRKTGYVADFFYTQNGRQVVEDVKGFDKKRNRYIMTQVFTLKWKLLMAKYPEFDFRIF